MFEKYKYYIRLIISEILLLTVRSFFLKWVSLMIDIKGIMGQVVYGNSKNSEGGI